MGHNPTLALFESEWKTDLINICIGITFCPQCGKKTTVQQNLYFPDRDTYLSKKCNIAFTPITTGEIVITHGVKWDKKMRKWVRLG